jgi:hypothetical protein
MSSPTLTPPRPRPPSETATRRLDAELVARIAFGLLCLGFAIGFFVFPTYPNYDSYYSLLWGREVLDGDLPFFEGFRVPTQHPLAILAGAVLSLFGDVGDRLWIALIFVSFLGLVWGIYRLARVAFTPVIGLIAAALLVSRFDFGFLAARGYIDVPYLTLVIWAAALEAERPRRGTAVFVLLALAGMLRPRGLAAGRPLLPVDGAQGHLARARRPCGARGHRPGRLVRGGPGGDRQPAVLAAVHERLGGGPRPLAVAVGDPVGHPVLPVEHRQAPRLARGAGRDRARGADDPPADGDAVRAPALRPGHLRPDRRRGLSVIERYLIVAALALLVFAAVTLGGFTMLVPGSRWRTAWMAGAVLVVLAGAAYTVARVNVNRFRSELVFRGDAHVSLTRALAGPEVARGLRLRAAHAAQPQARAGRPLDRRPGGGRGLRPCRRWRSGLRSGRQRPWLTRRRRGSRSS